MKHDSHSRQPLPHAYYSIVSTATHLGLSEILHWNHSALTALTLSQCTLAGPVYTGMPLVDPVYTGIPLEKT